MEDTEDTDERASEDEETNAFE